MGSVGLSAYGMAPGQLVELAVCAEELGFDALWLGEHVLRPLSHGSRHPSTGTVQHHTGPIVGETTELTDPLAVLAAVAASTSRIALGTAVYVAALRHPLLTARTTITVQELSGGRLILGVGAGWLAEEFEALGVPFDRRFARTDECVEIMRKAWSGKAFSHDGDHYRFDAVQLHPRPAPVPVVYGGNGPQALARAARLGDGWFSSGTPEFGDAVALVREIRRLRDEAGTTGDFPCYVRVAGTGAEGLERYRDNGIDDLVLWADALWTGETAEERRAGLAAAAERLGLAGR